MSLSKENSPLVCNNDNSHHIYALHTHSLTSHKTVLDDCDVRSEHHPKNKLNCDL